MIKNKGLFRDNNYIRHVIFSKAVIWHTREISLPVAIIEKVEVWETKKIIFIDDLKKEKWIFSVKKVLEKMVLKSVGQEPQYYFPIDLRKVKKLDESDSYKK